MDSYHMIVILFMGSHCRTNHTNLAHIYLMKTDNRMLLDFSRVDGKGSVLSCTHSCRRFAMCCKLPLVHIHTKSLPFHSIILNTLFKRFSVIKHALTAFPGDKNERQRKMGNNSTIWYVRWSQWCMRASGCASRQTHRCPDMMESTADAITSVVSLSSARPHSQGNFLKWFPHAFRASSIQFRMKL